MKYILIALLFLLESAFINAQMQGCYNEPSLKEILTRLKKNELSDLRNQKGWNNLVNFPEFMSLTIVQDSILHYYGFKNAMKYRDSVLKFIQDKKNRWELKYYALALIQGLCIEDYLPVIDSVYGLVDKKIRLNPNKYKQKGIKHYTYSNYPELDLLYFALDQDGLSKEVFFNYKNPRLILLLNKIKENKILPPEFKDLCNSILSGLLYKNFSEPIEGFDFLVPLFKCDTSSKE